MSTEEGKHTSKSWPKNGYGHGGDLGTVVDWIGSKIQVYTKSTITLLGHIHHIFRYKSV